MGCNDEWPGQDGLAGQPWIFADNLGNIVPCCDQPTGHNAARVDIDQELHLSGNTIVNGFAGNQMRCVEQGRPKILRFQLGIIFQYFLCSRPLGQ